MKHKVTLRPSGNTVMVAEGQNLLVALRENDTYIKSSCGGHASCTDCVIKIVSGEDNLTPPPFAELKLLGNVYHITKERLACQTMITGEVTIDITKHDKATDEDKLKNKTTNFSKKKTFKTHVRKESDIEKIRTEREEERLEFEREQKENSEKWNKHWEKDKDGTALKKLAGGKRPKFFDTDKVDYEKNDYTRPLSADKQKLRDDRLANEKQDRVIKDKCKEIEKTTPESDKDFKKFRS